MSRNATNSATSDNGLTAKQSLAIASIVSGESITEAAETVGVHRSTVHRWLADPEVQAELNANRAELHQLADNQLLNLVGKAINRVTDAIEDGDTATALSILKGLGLLPGTRPSIGLVDARRIELQQRAQIARDSWEDEVGMLGGL